MEGHSAAMTRGGSISGVAPDRTKKIPPKKAVIQKNPPTAAGESARGREIKTKRVARRSSQPDASSAPLSPSPFSDSDPIMPPTKRSRQADTGGCPSSSRITRSSSRQGGLQVQTARGGEREDRSSKQPQKKNVRCCPGYVLDVLAMLNREQHDYVIRKGFGALFGMTVDGLETRGLLGWLMENTDPRDMIIRAGPGKNLEITKDVIHQILDLPNAGGLLEKPQWAPAVQEAKTFRASLGLGPGVITVDRMKDEVAKGDADDLTMRCFFLIVFNRLLFCKGAGEISKDHIMWTRKIEHFTGIDWCQLIYNDLCSAVSKWHSRDKHKAKTATIYGCSIVILLFYLDHLYDNAAPDNKVGTPRFKYFDSARIQMLIKADHKDGNWGSCDFRSRTQTCYAQGPSIYIPRLEGHSAAAMTRGGSISGVAPDRTKKIPPKRAVIQKKPPTIAGESARGRGIEIKRVARRSSQPDAFSPPRSPSPSSDSDPFMPPTKRSRQADTEGCPSLTCITRSSSRRGGLQVQTARGGEREDRSSKPRKSGGRSVRFQGTDAPEPQPAGPPPSDAHQQQKKNVRCCPGYVLDVLAMLNREQHDYVIRKGFGALFGMTVDGLETRGLLGWLMENTDPRDMIIRAGPGKNLEITKDVIHQILDLPNAGGLLEKPQWAPAVQEAKTFRASLGLGLGVITVDRMKDEVAKGDADDLTMRCFFLIVFNRLLFCKGAGDISKDHIMWTRKIEHFAGIDWCQLIYNDLCSAVSKWHSRDKHKAKTATVYGCSIVILLFYLDHLYDNAAPDNKVGTPRFKYFDSARIQMLIKADHKDGNWGSCDFRSRTQTCYAQGPSIYIPRLGGLLAHKISSCPKHVADRFQNFISYYDHEIGKLASSLEETRRQVVQKQIELAHNFGEMLDAFLCTANNQDCPINEDGANPGGNEADDGTGTQGNSPNQDADPDHAHQGATSDVNPDQLPEDEPSQSKDFSNLNSLTSQCVITARRGREYECNSPQYTRDLPDHQDLTETQVEKYNQEIADINMASEVLLYLTEQQ